ncbi:hypothetical protein AB0J82_28885 [Asanoa sp. NPDC049518]|uniref:hypothetical protein n=1 Tax=unclassified Asanoa TaxID=2685164 RepID=UPI003423DF6B
MTGYLRDWDRTLRAANHPETIRANYLLATAQLARYLASECDAAEAADDPCLVGRAFTTSTPRSWASWDRSRLTAFVTTHDLPSTPSGWCDGSPAS